MAPGNCSVLSDGLALQGFPGMPLRFAATMKDQRGIQLGGKDVEDIRAQSSPQSFLF